MKRETGLKSATGLAASALAAAVAALMLAAPATAGGLVESDLKVPSVEKLKDGAGNAPSNRGLRPATVHELFTEQAHWATHRSSHRHRLAVPETPSMHKHKVEYMDLCSRDCRHAASVLRWMILAPATARSAT